VLGEPYDSLGHAQSVAQGYVAGHTEVTISLPDDHDGCFVTRVSTRGYECDDTGCVTVARMFSYCEHQRWETMREPALGLLEAVHAGHFFVVLEQQLERIESFGMSVPLRIEMTLEQVGRSAVWVRHALRRETDGALLAVARVRGGWIGPNRRLARVPDALREAAARTTKQAWDAPMGPSATGGTAGSWFDPPTRRRAPLGLLEVPDTVPETVHAQRRVKPGDADIFSHVNAATYLRFFEDAISPGKTTWRASLRYKRESKPGDVLAIHAEPRGNTWHCAAIRDGELLVAAALEATEEPRVDGASR
jgi:acyl-CoA thioesterase FadM